MKLGALVGFGVWDAVTVPVGTAVGGFAGFVLGGLFGSEAAGQVAVRFYERMDESEMRQVDVFVYQHYGIQP